MISDTAEQFSEKLVSGEEPETIVILEANNNLVTAMLSHTAFNSEFRSTIAAALCNCDAVVGALLADGADIETEWAHAVRTRGNCACAGDTEQTPGARVDVIFDDVES